MQRTVSDNSDRVAAESMMLAIIDLAAATHPHPNPRVGAGVLSAGGDTLALAAHQAPGQPHAEVLALADAGESARGGTVVVTLEPCNHHGRTPPCTEAIIAAGISSVVVGAIDPDDRVAGGGISRLREAGIQVTTGVMADEVKALDPGYFHHRTTGRPLVTLKTATTLDGQAAAADGTSQWITSETARHDVHILRSRSDAVVIGAGTLLADDPMLDARLDGFHGPQPIPVIIAGRRPLPPDARIWERSPLVYSSDPAVDIPAGEYVSAPGPHGVDPTAVIKDLGARGIIDVLLEGGPTVARSFLDAGTVDRVVVYLAASIAGGSGTPMFAGAWRTLTDRTPLSIDGIRLIGPDIRVDASVPGEER